MSLHKAFNLSAPRSLFQQSSTFLHNATRTLCSSSIYLASPHLSVSVKILEPGKSLTNPDFLSYNFRSDYISNFLDTNQLKYIFYISQHADAVRRMYVLPMQK